MMIILNCFINLSFSSNLTFLILLQVIRSGEKVQSKKATGGQKQGGFFSSFFGRKSKKDEPEQEESKDKESN